MPEKTIVAAASRRRRPASGASHKRDGAPPLPCAILNSRPRAKNPSQRPSGEKNGDARPLGARDRHRVEPAELADEQRRTPIGAAPDERQPRPIAAERQ